MPLRASAVLLLVVMATASGCFHHPSPYMPESWPQYAAAEDILVTNADTPRLQIIIGYFNWWPNHTALRLVAPDRPVTFWDPGGGYGLKPPRLRRINDVIIKGAPDIPTYLPFRWSNNDELIEIFEWYLSDGEALRLHHILLAGANIKPDAQIDFSTDTPAFFCAAAISEFLHRFGAPTVRTEETTLLPSRLARGLYQKKPDRVLVFHRRERPQIQVMTRPPAGSEAGRMAREGNRFSEGVSD
ncbi:MAG: hypothetical protein JJV98_19365 [Desulfosarcina sp.]|nr:hypothetical protein [Desulfobacterales bacterium]